MLVSAVQKSDSLNTYIRSLFYILVHDGLSQDIEYSSGRYTVGPPPFSTLYATVSIGSSQIPSSLSDRPTAWQQVCSVHLRISFCLSVPASLPVLSVRLFLFCPSAHLFLSVRLRL